MQVAPSKSVQNLLLAACDGLEPVSTGDAWDYGWGYAPYRRSGTPIMNGPEGLLTLNASGLKPFETAVSKLLSESVVKERWHPEEFWSVIASLIATAKTKSNREAFVDLAVTQVRTVGPSLTVLLVSNVTWTAAEPIAYGDFVVGMADRTFQELLTSVAEGRSSPDSTRWQEWLDEQVEPRVYGDDAPYPVAFACWTKGQGNLAAKDAERLLDELIALCLLLEPDLAAHGVYRRGPTNRPGVRGLALDRGAIDRGLSEAARVELASFPLMVGDLLGHRTQVEWFSSEPLPLGDLLAQPELRNAVFSSFKSDFLSRTVRLSARWFEEAYFTLARDDAALALGVALDALLSGKATLPGSAMADRYALLHPDASVRKERRRDYQRAYSVRSAVAHGGTSSTLEEEGFIGQYLTTVHDAARRTLLLRDTFAPKSGKELDDLYDDLRLGVTAWPNL